MSENKGSFRMTNPDIPRPVSSAVAFQPVLPSAKVIYRLNEALGKQPWTDAERTHGRLIKFDPEVDMAPVIAYYEKEWNFFQETPDKAYRVSPKKPTPMI